MSSFEYLHVLKSFNCTNHSLLLVCDETLRLSMNLYKRLKYVCEGFRCFDAGNCDTKGYNTIITVDSSKYSHCILVIIICALLYNVISQVIAHYLTIKLKKLLHFRTDCYENVRKRVWLQWKWIHADVIVLSFKLFDDICEGRLISFNSVC
jgi:hypothetical protein